MLLSSPNLVYFEVVVGTSYVCFNVEVGLERYCYILKEQSGNLIDGEGYIILSIASNELRILG